VPAPSYTIVPGGSSETISIVCAPTVTGVLDAALVVFTNDTTQLRSTYPLRCEGNSATPPSSNSLIITGVFDGPLTGGTPKGLELYATGAIADLSVYGIGAANNGGGTDGEEFTLSGAAAQGDFIYIAYEGSNTDSFTNFFGFAPNFTTSTVNINGDDAIELFKNGTVIDVMGDVNVSGSGEAWDYLDGWAYGTASDGTFTASNWLFSGVDQLEGGSTNVTTTAPFPVGTYTP